MTKVLFKSRYKNLRICIPNTERRTFTAGGGMKERPADEINFRNGRYEASDERLFRVQNPVTGEETVINELDFMLNLAPPEVKSYYEIARGTEDAVSGLTRAMSSDRFSVEEKEKMVLVAADLIRKADVERKAPGPAIIRGVRSAQPHPTGPAPDPEPAWGNTEAVTAGLQPVDAKTQGTLKGAILGAGK